MFFFPKISQSFSRFLVTSWYDFIIFYFAIIFSMKSAQIVHIQSKYIQNQVVYYSILESQFISNLELFWTTKILVSTLHTMGAILCGDLKTEWSKIWKSLAI